MRKVEIDVLGLCGEDRLEIQVMGTIVTATIVKNFDSDDYEVSVIVVDKKKFIKVFKPILMQIIREAI